MTEPVNDQEPDEALCAALTLECQRLALDLEKRFKIKVEGPVEALAFLRLGIKKGLWTDVEASAEVLLTRREALAAALQQAEAGQFKPTSPILVPGAPSEQDTRELLADLWRRKREGNGKAP